MSEMNERRVRVGSTAVRTATAFCLLSVIAATSAANAEFTWSEDFDGLPVGPYSSPFWTPLTGTQPAGVAVTDATSVSSPNSLLFDPALIGSGTPNNGSMEAGILFEPALDFSPTSWVVEFDVRRDQAMDDSIFELVAYDADGGRRGLVALADYGIGPSLINISLGATFAQANLPYTWGSWIHIEWEIEYDGNGNGFQTVSVNDYPFAFLPMSSFNSPITSFGFILRDPNGEYSGSTYVDNVSFTAVPSPGSIALLGIAGIIGRRRGR